MSNLTRYYEYIAYAIVSRARLAPRESLVREAQDATLIASLIYYWTRPISHVCRATPLTDMVSKVRILIACLGSLTTLVCVLYLWYMHTGPSTTPGNGSEENRVPVSLWPPPTVTLPTWKPKTFCDTFVEHPFQDSVPVCGSRVWPDHSISCSRTLRSNVMATCTIQNLAVHPKKLNDAMSDCNTCRDSLRRTSSVWLLESNQTHCPVPTMANLSKATEPVDYMQNFVNKVIHSTKKPPSVCEQWINKTAYFFMVSQPHHIYFRFLAYFNVHRSLVNDHASNEDSVVIRISDAKNYKFEDFERALFPGILTLKNFSSNITCFRKVVLVPWAYACVLFRCRIDESLRRDCLNCDGTGLYGTSFMTFRTRVLNACSLVDRKENSPAKRLLVVSRKPYVRYHGDSQFRFQRVLTNEEELLLSLNSSFPFLHQTVVHLENLPLCAQVRYAHEADVLLGVHGAGLVHLWWLRENAFLFELVPTYKLNTPTLKMLARLAGRRHHGVTISGDTNRVTANLTEVVERLKYVL